MRVLIIFSVKSESIDSKKRTKICIRLLRCKFFVVMLRKRILREYLPGKIIFSSERI